MGLLSTMGIGIRFICLVFIFQLSAVAYSQCIFAPSSVCVDDCGPVFYLVNDPPGTTYFWTISCGTITNNMQANPHTACFTSPGVCTLQVIVTVPGGDPDTCTVFIDVIPSVSTEIDTVVCPGDSVEINGTYYTEGIWSDTLFGASSMGCDSILLITVTSHDLVIDSIIYQGCSMDGYMIEVNGTTYSEENPVGVETLVDQHGCDSTVFIQLIFDPPVIIFIYDTLCSGSGFSIDVNGSTYDESNPTGTEWLMAEEGCDTIVNIELLFLPIMSGTESYAGCQGDGYSVLVNGIIYNEANPSGIDTLTGSNGCDSIVTIDLVFEASVITTYCYVGCSGDGYGIEVMGMWFDESNPYVLEVLTGQNGCDSIIMVNLKFLPCIDTLMTAGDQLCAPVGAESYTWLTCECESLTDTTACITVSGTGCACVIVIDSTGLDTLCHHYTIPPPSVEIIQQSDSLCAFPDGFTYVWTSCGDTMTLSNEVCYLPPASGCYCVTAWTSGGEWVDSACVDVLLSSLDNPEYGDKGYFYADKSSKSIFYHNPILSMMDMHVILYDLQGRQVPDSGIIIIDENTIQIKFPDYFSSWIYVSVFNNHFRIARGVYLENK